MPSCSGPGPSAPHPRRTAAAAASAASIVVMQGMPARIAARADLVAVGARAPAAPGRVDHQGDPPAAISRPRSATPPRSSARPAPGGRRRRQGRGRARRWPRSSRPAAARRAASGHGPGLVGVARGDERGARPGQRLAGGALGLGEGLGEAPAQAHHLTGRPHLGAEHRVGAGEAREREHRLLDRDAAGPGVAAGSPSSPSRGAEHQPQRRARTSGTPVAFATKGTVREARGLASIT